MTAAAAVAIYPIPPAPMPEAGSHQGSRVGPCCSGQRSSIQRRDETASQVRLHPTPDPNPLMGVLAWDQTKHTAAGEKATLRPAKQQP